MPSPGDILEATEDLVNMTANDIFEVTDNCTLLYYVETEEPDLSNVSSVVLGVEYIACAAMLKKTEGASPHRRKPYPMADAPPHDNTSHPRAPRCELFYHPLILLSITGGLVLCVCMCVIGCVCWCRFRSKKGYQDLDKKKKGKK